MIMLLKMIEANLKLLMRNIGFLICILLIPIGAASILMVQQSDVNINEPHSNIIEIEKNASIISLSPTSMKIVAIDASQKETSEMFLNHISKGNILEVYRYKTSEIERKEIDLLAKSFYERGSVVAVIYIPADFEKEVINNGNPAIDVIKGRNDDRIDFVSNIINQNVSVMLSCAENTENKSAFIDSVKETLDKMPKTQSIVVGDGSKTLSESQTNHLNNIGYSVAILTLAFILTGCFIANLVVSERDNKTMLRINMSSSPIMLYLLAKAITAVIVSFIQAGITALAILLLIGTDIGIPFTSYILFISVIGIIFNLFCVVMSMFSKNILGVVYISFGVWIFTNILSKVYFSFVTFNDWMEKLSMITPQRWVVICSEMLMKNQSGAYTLFFMISVSFLMLVITAGFIGTKLQKADS